MLKRTLLIIAFLISSISLFAQRIQVPKIALSNVSFSLYAENIPDSVESVEIVFQSESKSSIYQFGVTNNKIDQEIIIAEAKNYDVKNSIDPDKTNHIRVIPGWLSLIPPLLAIILALVLRQVVVSLSIGIFSGALINYDFNPLAAFLRFADTIMLEVLIDKDHMFIIVFTLLIGGVVGVISKNGGTAGLAQQITKLAKTAKSGMISSWLMGVVIFFDDYANSLIIGNMMRPITDKLRISREKLAYIVDSTAAPVASIFLISTWIGYEVGLIGDGLKIIGSEQNAYDVFLRSIPYSFYPLAAIFFVFLTSYMQRDFGQMYKAEKRARTTGKVSNEDMDIKQSVKEIESIALGKKSKWYNGAIPILIILFGTIAGLFYTGILSLQSNGISDYSLQNIINYADAYSSLLWASLTASITAVIMSVIQRILSLHDALLAWEKGIKSMFTAVLILVFAWAISGITNDLKTADYVISLLSDSVNPRFLPAFVFIICAVIGFSTGTSWGTMAIVMPIVIPLTHKIGISSDLVSTDLQIIMYSVISSVLAGSVLGDHCSPIADTTVLSSLASKCNHIDHVRTQLPYAIVVGTLAIILGYIPSAYGLSPFISLALIFIVLIGLLLLIGKRTNEFELKS